jgi:hypothetical protein
MAGTPGQSGGKREGSGRKSKAEELQLPAMIEEIAGDEGKKEVLKKILDQAKAGSFNHQQLFMAYAFGKPTEKIDLTSKGKEIKQVTGLIVK